MLPLTDLVLIQSTQKQMPQRWWFLKHSALLFPPPWPSWWNLHSDVVFNKRLLFKMKCGWGYFLFSLFKLLCKHNCTISIKTFRYGVQYAVSKASIDCGWQSHDAQVKYQLQQIMGPATWQETDAPPSAGSSHLCASTGYEGTRIGFGTQAICPLNSTTIWSCFEVRHSTGKGYTMTLHPWALWSRLERNQICRQTALRLLINIRKGRSKKQIRQTLIYYMHGWENYSDNTLMESLKTCCSSGSSWIFI